MSFVSHAQNREDVLLWRALGHVTAGFYVDVGANDPNDDSVTKAFYDRGWSGINVEPVSSHIRALERWRPRDVNLCVAAGATEGEIELFDTPVRGLATARTEVAQHHRERGLEVRATKVPLVRLSTVLEQHAPAQIHFLKIDVEGFEEDVLRGMDFSRWRPWVVVIEATRPNSRELDADWDWRLTDHRYRCIYFDGLNRYYLAQEREELAAAFATPPNVFDDFVPAEQDRLKRELALAEERLRTLQEKAERASQFEQEIHSLRQQLAELHGSTSWRVTAPLRRAVDVLRAVKAKLKRIHKRAPARQADGAPDAPGQTPGVETFVWRHEHSLPHQAVAPLPVAARTESAGERGDPGNPPFWWRLVGHVEGHYSLAVVNRGLGVALNQTTGERVQWVGWHGQRYTPGNDLPADQRDSVRAMLGRETPPQRPVVSLVHHYPLIADEEPSDLRLALFFWEESLVPADMVAHLMQHTDAVLVTSQFVRRVLRHSGYAKPVFVIPMGLEPFATETPLSDAMRLPEPDRPFRFLHVSSAFERKGVDVLLEAFFSRFKAADNVELVIKTFANPHHQINEQVDAWRRRCPEGPVVRVMLESLDADGMRDLYLSAHAMVLPSRGEGFNLPAAEALALGVPLITTGLGGQADFATLQQAALVPCRMSESRSHLATEGSFWAEPDAGMLADQMTMVRDRVQRQDADLNRARRAAADWMRAHYRWDRSAASVMAAAKFLWHERQQPSCSGRPHVVVLSPWSTACGIAEYAEALIGPWHDRVVLEVLCDRRTPNNPAQHRYSPNWTLGDSDSVERVLRELLERPVAERPEVLVVQHQQSLFLLTDGVCEALAALHSAGVVVVLELHSTLPVVREGRLSDRAAAWLRCLDLIVVHKLDDVNHMLGIGLAANVMCLPHGVRTLSPGSQQATRAVLGLEAGDLVLGCFGFLLPHKGIDIVIGSLPGLARATGRRVRLLAVTAALDERSRETLSECQRLAESLDIADQIVWVTDFRPIEECMRILAVADMHVFAYGPTRESASGAVTIGLATERPVLVTPQPIFSDLADCTYQLDGQSAESVTRGVMALLQNPELAAALVQRQRQWLNARAWPVLSARLEAAVRGLRWDRLTGAAVAMANPPRQRQLLVDVSEIVMRDAGTGIQRVVRNILQEWQAVPPVGFVVRPVCARPGDGYRYAAMSPADDAALAGEPVSAGLGDVFVGLDLSAHLFPAVESQLRRWRLSGVRVCYVVYDIIPLLYPRFVVDGLKEAFDQLLRGLRREADRLICISDAVAQEVRLWMCGNTEEGALPMITHFHLGSDLPVDPATPVSEQDTALLATLGQRPSLLMVGTVEPRKGHAQALDAMERLWSGGTDMALVVVGKRGWMVDGLCERLHAHPEYGKRLIWLEQASDATLTLLYRHCSGLLAASEAEGFGLPLVEAAHQGLPILARDIAVFRELAGDHARYFSGSTGEALAESVRQWLALRAAGRVPGSAGMPRLNWRESAAQLLERVL